MRAWLTGDELELDGGELCRRLVIPHDQTLIAAVTGALHELTLEYNWQQVGTMTPTAAAEIMRGVVYAYLNSDDCNALPPPFWDDQDAADADDTEDDAPLGTFPWYEEAADFVVTAFLATSFEPTAAIAFVTTARKFRLAFRSRNYGAVLRIFLNDVLHTSVDTYSAVPGIAYADIIVPGGSPANTELRIEHSGTANPAATPTAQGYGMEVIRKRLSEDDMGIQDVQLSAGNIQVKRTVGGAWENIIGGEVVRRDGTLNPDIQSDFTQSGGVIDFRYNPSGNTGRLFYLDSTIYLGHSGGIQAQMTIHNTAPIGSIAANATVLSTTLQFFLRRLSSTTTRDAAGFRAGWLDSVDAVRRGYLDMFAVDAAGERKGIRIGTTGTAPTLGVLGAAGIVRPTLTGGDGGNVALRTLIDRLSDFGFLVDATTEETAESGFVDFTDDQRCRVAYGVAFLWREHAQTFRDALEANAATLDAIDPSTYDPVMAAFPPGFTNYNDARQWLIDRTVDWSTDTTPPPSTFAGWLNSLENWLDIELINIQCALYRVIPAAAYLSETVIDDWRDELALTIQPPLDAVTYFFQGLLDFTNRVSLGALVNAATALGLDSWDCLDCLPGSLEFNFESAASNTLEGATVKLWVVMNASLGGATGSPIDVNISIGGGTAAAADYTLLTPSVTFPAGSVNGARQEIQIAIEADADTGDGETIIIDLSPESGAVGATAQHTLTIQPGGIAKTWLKDFAINTTNGLQGWTLENGTLQTYGISDEDVPGGSAFDFSAIASLTLTIPHSSKLTSVLARCTIGGGSRHAYVSYFGDSTNYPPTTFPVDGNLSFGESGLDIENQTGVIRVDAGNQVGDGYWDLVRLQGTGIDPFTGL